MHGLALNAAVDPFVAKVGIARYGQPEDIADVVAFLFAPERHGIPKRTFAPIEVKSGRFDQLKGRQRGRRFVNEGYA